MLSSEGISSSVGISSFAAGLKSTCVGSVTTSGSPRLNSFSLFFSSCSLIAVAAANNPTPATAPKAALFFLFSSSESEISYSSVINRSSCVLDTKVIVVLLSFPVSVSTILAESCLFSSSETEKEISASPFG